MTLALGDATGGGLRHAATLLILARHLPPRARVLDAAGGTGDEAVVIALEGHEVTVLDPAGAHLACAISRAEAHGVSDRVHVVQARAEDAPELFPVGAFDAALCHNLLHLAEDPATMLRALTDTVRTGGLVSVLTPSAAPVDGVVLDLCTEVLSHESVVCPQGNYLHTVARVG